MAVYAHSLPGRPVTEWELLNDHLEKVGAGAGRFASIFGWGAAAEMAGRLHDIGKTSAQFQAYIRAPLVPPGAEHVRGGDHSSAGARVAVERFGLFGRLLAFGIAGHHAGLGDGDSLDRRLDPKRTTLPPHEGWEHHAGPLAGLRDLAPAAWRKLEAHKGFSQAFLARMLFSCLVDADFLETEQFYAQAEGAVVRRGQHACIPELLDRLRASQASRHPDPTPLNLLRAGFSTTPSARPACRLGCSR